MIHTLTNESVMISGFYHNICRREASQFHVSVSWNRGESDNPAKLYRIRQIVNHPSYDPSRSKLAHDISLIQLAEDIVPNSIINIQPICLPDPIIAESLAGSVATVAGWGRTSSGQQLLSCIMFV